MNPDHMVLDAPFSRVLLRAQRARQPASSITFLSTFFPMLEPDVLVEEPLGAILAVVTAMNAFESDLFLVRLEHVHVPVVLFVGDVAAAGFRAVHVGDHVF